MFRGRINMKYIRIYLALALLLAIAAGTIDSPSSERIPAAVNTNHEEQNFSH